jgi:site-specific recombinase XerD
MRSTPVMTLTAESIENYRNWCIARGQSHNTAKAYSTDLRMMLMYFSMTTISLSDYEALATTWLNETRQGAAPKTTGRRLTSLRGFAKWAKLENELEEYKAPKPARGLPRPLPERLDGLVRLEQVAPNPEQRALVGCGGYVGLRISETLAFHTSWLDTSTMMLRVRGKGDKERYVPVSERAWQAIERAYVLAMGRDGYLVSLSDRSARKAITMMGQRAGLCRVIASHDLRATYATIMSENNVPPRVIQELLGHANLASTEIYTGVEIQTMKGAVNF